MTGTQRLSAALTSLDDALARLLDGVRAVAPIEMLLADAVGCVAAETPKLGMSLPPFDIAVTDGWATRAQDIAGASSYAPVLLSAPPVWVEAGERLPDGCDCVIDESAVEQSGPMLQIISEAIPGEGVRRAGEDIAAGAPPFTAGRRVAATDVISVRVAGRDTLPVRRPRVRIIGVPAHDGRNTSAEFIAASAREAGAQAMLTIAVARDAQSIASAIGDEAHDLLLIVGGSGTGRTDAAVAALAARGNVAAHGLALRPGRTAAIGKIGPTPVVAIPGVPAHALAAWLAVGRPTLDRLALHAPRPAIIRPLARKISSAIGFAELVLLKAVDGSWAPLVSGDLPLGQIVAADTWLIVPGDSEGYAAGTPVGALPLRDIA